MRKQRIYLDTSIINYLFADDTPDKKAETWLLWEQLEKDKFEIFISQRLILELDDCGEPKKSELFAVLDDIKYTLLQPNEEVENLAQEYLNNNVLTQKSIADCEHIAYAVVANCDIITSWNFKHFVNLRTINGVRFVNSVNKYREISIVSPSMILGES